MQPHSRRGSKRRRSKRKYSVLVFVGVAAVMAGALVALLVYALTSAGWRMR